MANTDWVSPGTVVSDSTVGTVAWSNPSNAKASDDSYAEFLVFGGGYCKDTAVKIVKSDGSVGSTNKANTEDDWPASDTYESYGASDDLWGETWSASDINDSDFGVVLQAEQEAMATMYSEYLKATNLGFDIPEGSTIDGIEARVERNHNVAGSLGRVDHIQIKVYYTESTGTPVIGQKYPLPAFRHS